MDLNEISLELANSGLSLLGFAPVSPEQQREYGFTATAVALVGNAGPAMWPVFSSSPEFKDGQAHPLDRWSRRIAAGVCARFDLQAVFPFTGPPYLPFQRWANAAQLLEQSPLGLLIHPEYGLWHAYRFALLLPAFKPNNTSLLPKPMCSACIQKPCLTACPVSAITTAGYDVGACIRYLERDGEAQCHQQGCVARFSCPEAVKYRYEPAQSRFHLQAFYDAHRAR